MKNVGIITNIYKDKNLSYTKELVLWLEKEDCCPLVPVKIGAEIECGNVCRTTAEIYEKSDFLVVLGGDGTILRNARRAAKYGLPILGINFGTLGYLADVERAEAKNAIKAVLCGDYSTENRMLLSVSHIHNGQETGNYLALNEVYVSNSISPRMAHLEMSINDDLINTFNADGIIVATPTGSTAYSLSAGGPILKPDTRLMAITTVCSHDLFSRPFVINGEDVVYIRILDDKNMIFSLDGEENVEVEKNDIVKITMSQFNVKIIKTSDRSFYDTLRRKMMGK